MTAKKSTKRWISSGKALRVEHHCPSIYILNACVFLVSISYAHGRARKCAKKATKITEVELLCYEKWVQMLGFSPLERRGQKGLMIKAYRVTKPADEMKIILNSYHTRIACPETNSG